MWLIQRFHRMWQLHTTEHTNQDNNQSILIKGVETDHRALIPTATLEERRGEGVRRLWRQENYGS